MMWRFVYWWKLPGLDRRLRVAFSWLLDLLVPPETVQLRLESQGGVQELHFEPGEYVFHAGDRWDSLYVIISGSAEVVSQSGVGGQERILTVLQAGEFFGEIAMLQQLTRTASVRCRTQVNVVAMPQRQFQTLARHLPQFRAGFESAMEDRLQRDEG